jgi:predicted Holliday junction resolvase-like endonuclease
VNSGNVVLLVILFMLAANGMYLHKQIGDVRQEIQLMEQHIQTDLSVIEQDLTAKVLQRIFAQRPSRIPPLAERTATEARLKAEIEAKARAKAEAKLPTPAPAAEGSNP